MCGRLREDAGDCERMRKTARGWGSGEKLGERRESEGDRERVGEWGKTVRGVGEWGETVEA